MVYFIGIGGGSSSGKSTVARAIANVTDKSVAIISLDNYYKDLSHLPFEKRVKINYDHPNAFEWNLFKEHLKKLKAGKSIEMPQYNFKEHLRKRQTKKVDPAQVVIIEGILALYDPEVRKMLDLKIYVQTDADERILRRMERDIKERGRTIESVRNRYLTMVKPMHEKFVEPTKKYADLIIPKGGFNKIPINLIKCWIERNG